MHNPSERRDFLAKLPPLLATLSKAFLIALKEQTLEVARVLRKFLNVLGRLLLRSAKWLWAIYYRVETQILGVIVDFVLAVVALRYFFLLLVTGVVLVYFEQWLLVVVYVLLLIFAAFRFFRIDSEAAAREEEYHRQSHDRFIRLLVGAREHKCCYLRTRHFSAHAF
jgi:fatty acid desaturase